jgi:hypothetical protein
MALFLKGDAVPQQEGHREQIRPWEWSGTGGTSEDRFRDSSKNII